MPQVVDVEEADFLVVADAPEGPDEVARSIARPVLVVNMRPVWRPGLANA